MEGGETMVSDQDIAKGVQTLLRQSNPNSVNSVNGVIQQLGAKLGLDLSHKASFIRDQINLHLRQFPPQPPSPSPPPPPSVSKDHFTLQNYPQFLNTHFDPNLLQQQQRFPPHFALQFAGFRGPFPPPLTSPQHHHAPPQVAVQPQPVLQPVQLPPKSVVKSPKESNQSGAKRRGGAGGLNKLCGVSPELQAIVGEAAMSRTEIVKQLWAYIRKNSLQDPSNKRKIVCDDALRAVFETDCTDMFKMNKLLSKHITSLAASNDPTAAKRLKVDIENATESSEELSPITISESLTAFLGTTRREMLPSEATQLVWDYIKANHLEDSSSMTVICDAKLRELFECESVPVLGMNEMLARHFFQGS